jgi:hypothetical protein
MKPSDQIEAALNILTEHLGEFFFAYSVPSPDQGKVQIKVRYRGAGIIPAMVLSGSPVDAFYQTVSSPFDMSVEAPIYVWDPEEEDEEGLDAQ